MRALVTGGAGFIGSHLTDALVAAGDTVHVVDDFSSGRLGNIEDALERGCQLHPQDVTDAAAMADLAAEVRPHVIYHLAAQIDVRRSVSDPAFDAQVNVAGTVAVLDAARRCGTGRLVLASTAGVYGAAATIPTTESAALAPLSPYGAGKAAAESYLVLWERLHGLPTLALRMANVYGSRQDPDGEAGVVAIFSGAAAEGRPAVIFGGGSQTRDYVHVLDVVAAFVAAGRSRSTGALNVSTGRETSVRDLATAIGLTVEVGPARRGEVERSCLDPTAASRALGWRARIDLPSGLQQLRTAPPVPVT